VSQEFHKHLQQTSSSLLDFKKSVDEADDTIADDDNAQDNEDGAEQEAAEDDEEAAAEAEAEAEMDEAPAAKPKFTEVRS
jgi:hypothetical protein